MKGSNVIESGPAKTPRGACAGAERAASRPRVRPSWRWPGGCAALVLALPPPGSANAAVHPWRRVARLRQRCAPRPGVCRSPPPRPPASGSRAGAVIPGQPGAPPRIGGGLSPAQLVAAYDTGPLYSQGITGKGQTIVIVDPFGSPTIEQDLAAYDKAWHLPAPPSFRVIAPAGPVPPFRPTGARTGAAIETTLDVESAHLLAPGAGILLVETPTAETEGTAGFPEIAQAEEYVIRHHLGSVISMSLGATERTFPSRQSIMDLRSAFIDASSGRNMITLVAASGDDGAAGLMLNGKTVYRTRRSDGRPATRWSSRSAAPGWARRRPVRSPPRPPPGRRAAAAGPRCSPGRSSRARSPGSWAGPGPSLTSPWTPPATAAWRYTPRPARPGSARRWNVVCGTSLAAPLFAGVVALADQRAGRPLGRDQPAAVPAGRAA